MDLIAILAAIPGAGPAIPYVLAGVATAATVATALPPPTQRGGYATFYALINAVGMNFGKARNGQPPQG